MALEFNPGAVAHFMVSLPTDYKGGLLFLVPIPPGAGFTGPNMFHVYRADQVLVLGPASILEGFGRQP